ncbi:MAG: cupin domain-containing protein [Lachnospiraceae bacterium]|nr:cupin domain-containing protein [Lachnospiraceae bacterium]
MIRKKQDCQIEYREHMRGGDGTVKLTGFISGPEELCGTGRLFSRIALEPGCSIGFHVHEGDSELFYILRGTGIYNDGGTEVTVQEGDVTICPAGTGHGMANRSDEVLEMIAVIVYA